MNVEWRTVNTVDWSDIISYAWSDLRVIDGSVVKVLFL